MQTEFCWNSKYIYTFLACAACFRSLSISCPPSWFPVERYIRKVDTSTVETVDMGVRHQNHVRIGYLSYGGGGGGVQLCNVKPYSCMQLCTPPPRWCKNRSVFRQLIFSLLFFYKDILSRPIQFYANLAFQSNQLSILEGRLLNWNKFIQLSTFCLVGKTKLKKRYKIFNIPFSVCNNRFICNFGNCFNLLLNNLEIFSLPGGLFEEFPVIWD